MSLSSLADRLAGSLLGLALGDALGFVVEAAPAEVALAYARDELTTPGIGARAHARAQDRPELRLPPWQPALRAAGERAVGLTTGRDAARVRLGLELRENSGRISFRRSIGQDGTRGISALDESFRFRDGCLENRYTGNGIVGSNPTLSAER